MFAFVEHSFSHHPGAGPGKYFPDDLTVIVVFFAFVFHSVCFPECFLDKHPVVHCGAIVAHRILRATVVACHEAVEGDGDVDEGVGHICCFSKGILLWGIEKCLGPTFNGCVCDER